ncbi:resolvase, partial [Clostridium tertium]|nr:resolvase [Clostridium tertium]
IYKLKNKDVFNSSYNKNLVNNKKAISSLEKKIKTIDKNINNLTDKLSLLSNEASIFIVNRIELLTTEKTKIRNEIIELEMQELENMNVNYDFVFYNVRSFNDDMTVDDKRSSVMNIFKEIVYDPKTDTFEFSFK